jgi:hypothetical protein
VAKLPQQWELQLPVQWALNLQWAHQQAVKNYHQCQVKVHQT